MGFLVCIFPVSSRVGSALTRWSEASKACVKVERVQTEHPSTVRTLSEGPCRGDQHV